MIYKPALRPALQSSWGPWLDAEFRKITEGFLDQTDTVVGTVTLADNTTSTTISHGRIRDTAIIVLTPLSASSAAFLGSVYQSTTINGSLTLAHTDPNAALTFNYVIHIPLRSITR